MIGLAAWLLFLLTMTLLGLFITIVMWRDDNATGRMWEEWVKAEAADADLFAGEADELEELYATAQEQLYAKLTIEEAMAGRGRIVVVSDADLQSFATTGDGQFTFEKLVTSELDDER